MSNDQFDFETEFEKRLLAFLVRDLEFFNRVSFVKFYHFKNQYCRDICEQAQEYVQKYNQAIPKDVLRNEIEKMFYERKRQDCTLDEYWDFIDNLFTIDLSGEQYTEDEVIKFAREQQMKKVLGDAIDRVTAHQDLTPILADVTKAVSIGNIGKTGQYNFITGKELIKMEETEVKWFWDGILPAGGLSLLLAKPKVGKTVFALNLAFHTSKGDPFLGKSVTKGDVIYLALEESKAEVKKSLIAFDKTHGEPDEEHLIFHFGIAPSDAIKKLEEVMEIIEPKFVVIDILQKFMRFKKIDDYSEVTIQLEPVMAMARKLGCHIMLLHHAPKAERALIDSALGSTALGGAVDTVLLIKEDFMHNKRRSFSTAQRYRKPGEYDVEDWIITLAKDDITLELAGTTSEVNANDTKEQILNLLENIGKDKFYEGPMTVQQITDEIKKDKTFTLKCLKELYEEKRIKKEGGGHKGDPIKYSLEPAELWRRTKKEQ